MIRRSLSALSFLVFFGGSAAFAQLPWSQLPWSQRPLTPAPGVSQRGAENAPPLALAVDETLPARLRHVIDSVYEATIPEARLGISVSVIAPGMPQWSGVVGVSSPGEELRMDHLFELASVSKTYTTARIMKLEEEGKLKITDSIGKYLSDLGSINGKITIRQLLDHSSGLFDYLNDDSNYTCFYSIYYVDPSRKWLPREILSEFVGQPNFLPGKGYQYSNTGFLVLGMVIEAVTGRSLETDFATMFAELGLHSTFPGVLDSIKGEFANNWIVPEALDGNVSFGDIDKTAHLSAAWSAGYVVATAEDAAKFANALYAGTLLTSSSLTKMKNLKQWSTGQRYGLGTAWAPYYTYNLFGHSGRLLGFNSMVYTQPETKVTIAILSNADLPDDLVSTNDYAVAMLQEIYRPAVSSVEKQPIEISIYPNPATNFVLVQGSGLAGRSLDIYNTLGERVEVPIELKGTAIQLDVSSLVAGPYQMIVTRRDGTLQHSRIQVLH